MAKISKASISEWSNGNVDLKTVQKTALSESSNEVDKEGLPTRFDSGEKNKTSGKSTSENLDGGNKKPHRRGSRDARSRRSRTKSRSRSRSLSRSRKRRSSSRNRNRRSVESTKRGKDRTKRSRSRSKDWSKRSRSRSKDWSKRSRSRSKDWSKRSRSRSKDWSKRSRSRSKDRTKRSRSRSKDWSKRSRSRSKDWSKRSRSRSKDWSKRSRSRSKDRSRRTRSRSKDWSRRSRSRSKDWSKRSRSRSKDRSRRTRSRSKDKAKCSRSGGRNDRSRRSSSSSKTASSKNVCSRIIRKTDANRSPRSENKNEGPGTSGQATMSTNSPSIVVISGVAKNKRAHKSKWDVGPLPETTSSSSLLIERSPSGAVVSISTWKNVAAGNGPSISNISTEKEYALSLAERKRRLDIEIQLGLQKIQKLSSIRQSSSNGNEIKESTPANDDASRVKEGSVNEDPAKKIADENSLNISHEKTIKDVEYIEESLAVIQKNSIPESTDKTIETEKNTPPKSVLEETSVNLALEKIVPTTKESIEHIVEADLVKPLSENDSKDSEVSLIKTNSMHNMTAGTSSNNVDALKSEALAVGVSLDDNKNDETISDNLKTSKSEVVSVGVSLDGTKNAETNSDGVKTPKSEALPVEVSLGDIKYADTISDNVKIPKSKVEVSLDDTKNAETISDNVKIPKSEVEVSLDDTKNAETIYDNLKTPKSEVVSVGVSLDITKNAETISDNSKIPKSEVLPVEHFLDDTKNADTIFDNLKIPKSEVDVSLDDTKNVEKISDNFKIPKSEVVSVRVSLDHTKNADTSSDNVNSLENLKPSHSGGVTVEVPDNLRVGKNEMEKDFMENMDSTAKIVIPNTTKVPDDISENASNMKDLLITSGNDDKHGEAYSGGDKKSTSEIIHQATDEQKSSFEELDKDSVQISKIAEVEVQKLTSVEPVEKINEEIIVTESHAVNETVKTASDISGPSDKSGICETSVSAFDNVDNSATIVDAGKSTRASKDESDIKASSISCTQQAIEDNVVDVVQPCDEVRDNDIGDNLDQISNPIEEDNIDANKCSNKLSEDVTTTAAEVGGKNSEEEKTTKNQTDVMLSNVCTRKKSVDESTYAIDKIVQLADGMINPETSSASTIKEVITTDGNELTDKMVDTDRQLAENVKTLADSNGRHVENAEDEAEDITDESQNVGEPKTDSKITDPDRSVDNENKKLAADYSRKLIVQLRNIAIDIDSTTKKNTPTEKSATLRDDHQPEEPKQTKRHLDEISIAKKLKPNKHLTINLVRMSLGVNFNREEIEEKTGCHNKEIEKKRQSKIERRILAKRRPSQERNDGSENKILEMDTKPHSRESSEEPILIPENIPLVQVDGSDDEEQSKQESEKTEETLPNLTTSNVVSVAEEIPSTSHNTENDKSSSRDIIGENVTKEIDDTIKRYDSPILLTISSDEEDTSHDKICFIVEDSDDEELEYVGLKDIFRAE